jgi:hypothetical protein
VRFLLVFLRGVGMDVQRISIVILAVLSKFRGVFHLGPLARDCIGDATSGIRSGRC